MTISFEFATSGRIIFGSGKLSEAGTVAGRLGNKAFVVIGGSQDRAKPLLHLLAAVDIQTKVFQVLTEPTVATINQGLNIVRGSQYDMVISFGGGSVIDTGKAVAILATNDGDVFDYLEVIGKGTPLVNPPLPHIAIPTTAGTGSEVSRNAVIGSPENKVKVSLRSPMMLPTVALIDPELTLSLPPRQTAFSGMDTLTQLIEPYVSIKSNPMTDALCWEGLSHAARSLLPAYLDSQDINSREDMCLASLFSGLALANAKLGAIHGFAGPLGGMLDAPHGAICACLLPAVLEVNLCAINKRSPNNPLKDRYQNIARILTGDPSARAEEIVEWAGRLVSELDIPKLSIYGLSRTDFPQLIENAARSSSMQGNPIRLTPKEMEEILEKAL